MTLTEAQTAVRTLLRDHAMHLADTSVLQGWLEQGQKDTAASTYCYQRLATYTQADSPQALAAGERSYVPSGSIAGGGLGLSDYLGALHVTWNGVPLLRWTPAMTHVADVSSEPSGTPRAYQMFGDAFLLLPPPSAAVLTTYTLQFTYAALPSTWTSGAGVLPVGPDTAPVWFTACRIAMERRKWTQAAQWHGLYMALIQRVRLQQLTQLAQDEAAQQVPMREERDDLPRRQRLAAQQLAQARRR